MFACAPESGLDVHVIGTEQRLGARWPRVRRRRIRIRRSNVFLDTLRRVLFVSTEPPEHRAADKFSDAMSSKPSFCLWISCLIASAISGSVSASVLQT
jgi:hypothetical protein